MLISPEGACFPGADWLMTTWLPELVGDAGQLLRHRPQAAGVVGVVRLLGRLHACGRTALLHEAARAEELTALDVGSGGAVQHGQGTVGGRSGSAITPALLTRMSRWSRSPAYASANLRTDARSARSSNESSADAPGALVRNRSSASVPRPSSRQAITTRAPWRASSRAVS